MTHKTQHPDHICIFLDKDKFTLEVKGIGQMQAASLPKEAALIFAACSGIAHTRLVHKLFSGPGTYLLKNEERKFPDTPESDLYMHQLETFVNATSPSASKWWLTFLNENQQRQGLVNRVIFELKARGANIDDFFHSYVYANTENIGGNLSFMDYQHALLEQSGEPLDGYVKSAIDRMLPDVKANLEIEKSGAIAIKLWNKIVEKRYSWNMEDCLALLELRKLLNGGSELVRICSLAQSIRPLAMLHYYNLLVVQPKHLINLLRCEPEFYAEKFAHHAKYQEICLKLLLDKLKIDTQITLPTLSLDEIESLAQQYAMPKSSPIYKALLSSLSLSSLETSDAGRIHKALRYGVPESAVLSAITDLQDKKSH